MLIKFTPSIPCLPPPFKDNFKKLAYIGNTRRIYCDISVGDYYVLWTSLSLVLVTFFLNNNARGFHCDNSIIYIVYLAQVHPLHYISIPLSPPPLSVFSGLHDTVFIWIYAPNFQSLPPLLDRSSYRLSHSTRPFLWRDFQDRISWTICQAGFQPGSSWSPPPEQLGSQA
jgi:hypothetical protein